MYYYTRVFHISSYLKELCSAAFYLIYTTLFMPVWISFFFSSTFRRTVKQASLLPSHTSGSQYGIISYLNGIGTWKGRGLNGHTAFQTLSHTPHYVTASKQQLQVGLEPQLHILSQVQTTSLTESNVIATQPGTRKPLTQRGIHKCHRAAWHYLCNTTNSPGIPNDL